MGKETILSNGKNIHMFDGELGIHLSLKNRILKYNASVIIHKVGIVITAYDDQVIGLWKQYYEQKSLMGFQGPVIVLKAAAEGATFKDMERSRYRIDQQDGIVKADDNDNNFLFLGKGVRVRVNKGLHYGEIVYTNLEQFADFLPYIIRIVEGLVIENHLKLGYFPLHGALVKGSKEQAILIMGDSQAGKSTTAEQLCKNGKREILSDDIVFMDANGQVIPYGHYCKVTGDGTGETFRERIQAGDKTIYRSISRIPGGAIPRKVECVVFPQIVYGEPSRYVRMTGEERTQYITQLLATYPNQWFLYSDYNRVLGYQMVCELSSNRCYRLKIADRRSIKS